MKKQQELIHNCTNDHDRKLMVKSLDKHNKIMDKAHILIGLSFISIFIMFIGLKFELWWSIIPTLIIVPITNFYVMFVSFKGVGLI